MHQPWGPWTVGSRSRAILIALAAAVIHLAGDSCDTALAGHVDGFESGEPTWRDVGGDGRYRVEQRLRVQQQPHGGTACEFWQIQSSGDGSAIYLAYDVGQAPIIDETTVGLWVRSDRPNLRLLARVVFPRTLEPRTNRPVTALLLGTTYGRPGEWEQLTVSELRKQVEQQARVLRVQLRIPVDTQQAYIDRVLLNVYAGQGTWGVWLDDLEVTGIVTPPNVSPPGGFSDSGLTPATPISRTTTDVQPAAESLTPTVELRGASILARGRPFFPRLIDYNGEPLTLLRQIGFNTVRFRTTPVREILDEAGRLGLWIVCPPPRPPEIDGAYGSAAPAAASSSEFGPWFAPVLAWDLGEGLTAADVDVVKRWADYVRRNDLPRPRPTLCQAAADIRLLSRQVDIVTAYRFPLGTSFELADYGAWLRGRAGLTRPGTPIWTVVQTQPGREIVQQSQLLGVGAPAAMPRVDAEQTRLMLFEALAAGVRGVSFASSSSLAADDADTQVRAAALRLMNWELELIDAWAATGTFVTRVSGSQPDVSGSLLQIDRGYLLLPMWTGTGAQYVAGQSAATGLSFVVPGIPESVDVYEIMPGGMRPLQRTRVAGGVRIHVDEFSLTTLILFTQDTQVVNTMARRLAVVQNTIAETQRQVVEYKLRQAEEIQARLRGTAPAVREADGLLYSANASLRAADQRFSVGALREGYLETRRALRPIALVERAQWKNAVDAVRSSDSLPFTASFTSLADFWPTWQRIQQVRQWQNVLPGGELEGLDLLMSSGWKHFQYPQDGIGSEADLSPRVRPAAPPRNGQPQALPSTHCLRLAVRPTDERATQGLLESAPLWVASPPITVRAGQLLRISGWVNVPEELRGSLDGLLIYDSIGGDVTAQRFDKTGGWRQFTYYRVAPTDGAASLTVALTGYGEALVDDLLVEVAQ